MRYMNEFDVAQAESRFASHPILGPAVATLRNLVEWTNANSDGWPYWRLPCQAAQKLQVMIERDGTSRYLFGPDRSDVTLAEYRAALTPIKAFRTRQGATFEIVEARQEEEVAGWKIVGGRKTFDTPEDAARSWSAREGWTKESAITGGWSGLAARLLANGDIMEVAR